VSSRREADLASQSTRRRNKPPRWIRHKPNWCSLAPNKSRARPPSAEAEQRVREMDDQTAGANKPTTRGELAAGIQRLLSLAVTLGSRRVRSRCRARNWTGLRKGKVTTGAAARAEIETLRDNLATAWQTASAAMQRCERISVLRRTGATAGVSNFGAVARLRSPRHSIIDDDEMTPSRVWLAFRRVSRSAADVQPQPALRKASPFISLCWGSLADAEISPQARLRKPR